MGEWNSPQRAAYTSGTPALRAWATCARSNQSTPSSVLPRERIVVEPGQHVALAVLQRAEPHRRRRRDAQQVDAALVGAGQVGKDLVPADQQADAAQVGVGDDAARCPAQSRGSPTRPRGSCDRPSCRPLGRGEHGDDVAALPPTRAGKLPTRCTPSRRAVSTIHAPVGPSRGSARVKLSVGVRVAGVEQLGQDDELRALDAPLARPTRRRGPGWPLRPHPGIHLDGGDLQSTGHGFVPNLDP